MVTMASADRKEINTIAHIHTHLHLHIQYYFYLLNVCFQLSKKPTAKLNKEQNELQ